MIEDYIRLIESPDGTRNCFSLREWTTCDNVLTKDLLMVLPFFTNLFSNSFRCYIQNKYAQIFEEITPLTNITTLQHTLLGHIRSGKNDRCNFERSPLFLEYIQTTKHCFSRSGEKDASNIVRNLQTFYDKLQSALDKNSDTYYNFEFEKWIADIDSEATLTILIAFFDV